MNSLIFLLNHIHSDIPCIAVDTPEEFYNRSSVSIKLSSQCTLHFSLRYEITYAIPSLQTQESHDESNPHS